MRLYYLRCIDDVPQRSSQRSLRRYDPSGLYYSSPYQGTLTMPYNSGYSRGLTLRQLQEGVTP